MARTITPGNVSKARGFSHAIKVGNTVYVSGQVARDTEGNLIGKGDMVIQIERVYENLKRVVEAAGTTMTHIVKLNVYCKDLDSFAKTGDIRDKYFGSHYPAQTVVEVSRLLDPDCLIEVEAVAVLD